MWDVVLGLLAVTFGLLLVFAGLRFFFAALPILAFMVGFMVGGAGVYALFGDGFFSTVGSWLIGFVVGLVFAAISYAWWYAGALIAAGATGAAIGSALVRAFGGSTDWVIYLFAVLGFVVFLVVAFMLALPIYMVLVNTAFVGATIVVAGVLMLVDRVDRSDLEYGNAVALVDASWWWSLVVIVLAMVGIVSQLGARTTVVLPGERWSAAGPLR